MERKIVKDQGRNIFKAEYKNMAAIYCCQNMGNYLCLQLGLVELLICVSLACSCFNF